MLFLHTIVFQPFILQIFEVDRVVLLFGLGGVVLQSLILPFRLEIQTKTNCRKIDFRKLNHQFHKTFVDNQGWLTKGQIASSKL